MSRQEVVTISTEQFKQEIALAKPHIEKMLPRHLEYDKFEGMVISVVSGNPKLRECSQGSLIRAVIDGADSGLSLNPIMREADILPVWSPSGTKAQFRARAIGLMKLARQSGEIVKIEAEVIFANDTFDYEQGLEPFLKHKPMSLQDRAAGKDRGELIGAYCVWQLKDGTKQFEVLDLARIHRARASSEAWKYATKDQNKIDKNTPWIKHEEEMFRKTAIRAASKYMPQSSEDSAFMKALAADMAHENVVDGEFTEARDDAPDDGEKSAPTSGKTQVAALESRLGVAGQQDAAEGSSGAPPAGESQDEEQSQASAPAADPAALGAREAAPDTTARARRSRSNQTKPQTGGASTASQAEVPPDDTAERDAAVKDALPQDDSAEWEEEKPAIDWKAKAHDLRKGLIATGSDIQAFSAWITKTKDIRAQMAKESPDWATRLQKEIDGKDAYFKSRA